MSRADLLVRVQRALEGLYRVEAPGAVDEFMLSEEDRASLGVERTPREQLLLRHDPAGRTLDVGLFVDEPTLARLGAASPLSDEQLPDYLLAVEGVSHFLYVMVRAQAERPFSALELELQAEVDKYLLVLLGSWHHAGGEPGALRERLFRRVRYHEDLSPEERERYQQANAAADTYAGQLEDRYVKRRAVDDMLGEVRRFYRMDCAGKLDHIARRRARKAA